jgi:hypothetical protein
MRAALAIIVAMSACRGPGLAPDVEVSRAPPAASALLIELAPEGADLVLELDLARLRQSEALGELVEALRARASEGLGDGPGGLDLLAADELLMASYDLGGESAQALTLIRGEGVAAVAGAEILADDLAVTGPPALVARATEVVAGRQSATSSQPRLMELREAAIPRGAPGAALRVSGDLGFDARVGLSRLLALPDVPVAIAVWGDVVDDLAVVALLGAQSDDEAHALAELVGAWQVRAAALPRVRRLGLDRAVLGAAVTVVGATVRLTLVVSPTRLELAAQAIARELAIEPPPSPHEKE